MKKPRILATVVSLACLTPTFVFSTDYYVVVPILGKSQNAPTPGDPSLPSEPGAPDEPDAPETPLSVTLAPYKLPAATVSEAYRFELSSLLTVQGDPAFSGAGVEWRILEGTLPAGIVLQPDGALEGKPTVREEYGAQIQVEASYKEQPAVARYTLMVNGVAFKAKHVAVGGNFACAVSLADEAFCWGDNSSGELGDGTTTKRSRPVKVPGLSGVTALAAGSQHTCAIHSGGQVSCWGRGAEGQLGHGVGVSMERSPVAVSGVSDVVALAAGGSHTCALTSSGELWCWGSNGEGQFGDGTLTSRNRPTRIQSLEESVTHVTAGSGSTCAITASRKAYCWGRNHYYQLGNGTNQQRNLPTRVLGLEDNVLSIALGNLHGCAATTAGVRCWGFNAYGEVGDNSTQTRTSAVPVVGTDDQDTTVVLGSTHSCVKSTTGGLKCWGRGDAGALGTGQQSNRRTAISITHPPVTQLSAGGSNTCAVTAGGIAKCWGNNSAGQVGNGSTASVVSSPTDVIP